MEKNMMGSGLTGISKEKTVETSNFQVKGHLLQWKDVVIQISNISLITSTDVQPTLFPVWGLVVAAIGSVLIRYVWPIGFILLALSAYVFFAWYRENEKKKLQKFLYIQLNSGKSFSILFQSQDFLDQVIQTFANIFEDGDKTGNNYYFDLKNSKIDRNSSVIGNLHQ